MRKLWLTLPSPFWESHSLWSLCWGPASYSVKPFSKTPGCLSYTVLCCSVCTNTCELSLFSLVQDPGAEETATLASAAARVLPDKQALACMGAKRMALQVISLAPHVTCNLQLCHLRLMKSTAKTAKGKRGNPARKTEPQVTELLTVLCIPSQANTLTPYSANSSENTIILSCD